MGGGRVACQLTGGTRTTFAETPSADKVVSTAGVIEKSNAETVETLSDGRSQGAIVCSHDIVISCEALPFVHGKSHGSRVAAHAPTSHNPVSTATRAAETERRRFRDQWRMSLSIAMDTQASIPSSFEFLLSCYSVTRRSRNALVTTDTELRLIANAAIMGLSRKPTNG